MENEFDKNILLGKKMWSIIIAVVEVNRNHHNLFGVKKKEYSMETYTHRENQQKKDSPFSSSSSS